MIFKIWEFFQYTKKAHISAYAAYAVYFTMLSIFPLLMVILSVIHYLPIDTELLLNMIHNILPSQFKPLVESIVFDLEQKSSTTLLSISALSTLWASAKGIHGLYRGINNVYNVKKERNYFFRMLLCIFYTFFFIIVIILMLLLIVFGNQLQHLLLRIIPALESSSRILSFLRSLVSIALMMCFFMALYKFFPWKKLHLVAQIPGALFSTVCWMTLSFGFSFFVDHFGNYSYMYGSLTAIILLMLWIYLGMNIILYGGAINYWLDEHEHIYT